MILLLNLQFQLHLLQHYLLWDLVEQHLLQLLHRYLRQHPLEHMQNYKNKQRLHPHFLNYQVEEECFLLLHMIQVEDFRNLRRHHLILLLQHHCQKLENFLNLSHLILKCKLCILLLKLYLFLMYL